MDVAGIDGIGVIQRRVDAGTRFRFAPDKRRQPVLASPDIAARRVQPQHGQPGFCQRPLNCAGILVIGPVAFHSVEACRRGRAHGIRKRPVRPQKSQIGGEPGHSSHSTSKPFTSSRTWPGVSMRGFMPRVVMARRAVSSNSSMALQAASTSLPATTGP